MRNVLTKNEINSIIVSIDKETKDWIDDRRKRSNYFCHIVKSNNPLELLRLDNCIYMKRDELTSKCKNLLTSDIGILDQIERIIENEFSFVLDTSIEGVK